MPTSRPAARLILIVFLVWGASPAVAEVVFRALGAAPPTELEGLFEQLPDGNYRHRAWVAADANWFGGKFSVHTDGFGFRCDDARRFAARKVQAVDLLIVGDSQAFGLGVDFDESLAGTIIKQAARDRVRAANSAIGGHYLRNQLQLLQWLTENEHLRVKHYVILVTPYVLMAPADLNPADVGPDGRLYNGEVTAWKQAKMQIKTHLVLYAKVRDALRATILPQDTQNIFANTFLSQFDSGAAEARRAEAFLGFMTSFKQWAAQRDADVHLVYTPSTVEFEFEGLREAAKKKGVTIDSESPYRVTASVAGALLLPLHDLRPTLKAIHSTGQKLNLKGGDLHYNGTVSVAAGTRVWEALRPAVGVDREPHAPSPAAGARR
jgi:hypothetical protein